MYKIIKFNITDSNQFTKKVIEYFTQLGSHLTDNNQGRLKFSRGSSLFDTWTFNPLKWGSEIEISLNENEVTAEFIVNSVCQMNTIEERNVWNAFIDNFKPYLATFNDFKKEIDIAIKEVKRTRLIYLGWAIIGGVIGGILGKIFSNLTEQNMIVYCAIPIFATFFLTVTINKRKRKLTIFNN